MRATSGTDGGGTNGGSTGSGGTGSGTTGDGEDANGRGVVAGAGPEHPASGGRGDERGPERSLVTAAVADTTRQDLLVEAARRLGPDPSFAGLDDGDVADTVTTGAVQLAAATAQWLAALAELVVRGVWADDGCRSPATWLSWACGVGASTGREHVRVALRLRECPLVRERFTAGRLSYSKVRAITRVCTPGTEAMLLAWADAAPAAVLERIVADARRIQRAEQATDDRADLGARGRWLDDGTYELVVRVDAVDGIGIEQHLDRLVELSSSTPTPGVNDSGRDGEAEEIIDTPLDDHAGSAERPSRASRAAHAVADALAARVADGPTDTSGLDRHTVVVQLTGDPISAPTSTTTSLDTPGGPISTATPGASVGEATPPDHHGDDADEGAHGSTTTGGPISTEAPGASAGAATPLEGHGRHDHGDGQADVRTATVVVTDGRARLRAISAGQLRRLACTARFRLIGPTDGSGASVDLGRSSREPDARLRRQLRTRDASCRFPGCGAAVHLHAHHVEWWSHGGPTDLGNLVLLCRHHHAIVHDRGWTLRLDGPGRWTFHPPPDHRVSGDGPWPHVPTTSGASAAAVVAAASVAGRDIATSTLRPRAWDGERHDHDMAVRVLLERTAA